jgi:hypothetical protein
VDRNRAGSCDFGCLTAGGDEKPLNRWCKPSSWPSEKPTEVSAVGGNAVTEFGQSCYREPTRLHAPGEPTSPKGSRSQWEHEKGGADGEAPCLAKRGKPPETGRR